MKIRYIAAVLLMVLVLVGAFAFGLIPRLSRQKALLAASNEERERAPIVDTVVVRGSSHTIELLLPGNVQAIHEAPIYARADGYLRKLYVDIGDKVTKNQVLGEIETPELDQQLRQARASVDQSRAALKQTEAAVTQARANLSLAKITLDRWKQLVAAGVVPRQESDEKQATYDARQADVEAALANVSAAQSNISAAEANVQRLTELKSFDQLTAPFDGIITVRNTATGTLISAGTNSPNRELLREAQIDLLRIFVSVPQTNASAMRTELIADVSVQELPNRVFRGVVARTANALEEASRTLRTEIHVKNPEHTLLPGMYAQVKFSIARANAPPVIPGDTLVIRADGTQVAVVGPDRKVHFRKIELGRDYGQQIEVLTGLSEGETVIVNPTDEVREGVTVQPRK